MTADPEVFRDRARAESFGAAAADYDRFRPEFPHALLDDIAALACGDVLDVGSGTGKVARGLMRRGARVLGIEVDERMAAVARGHGVRVEVAPFETWDDAGRRFAAVTCGDAWHWIDPVRGAAKVAAVLASGGTFAWFWNLQLLDEPVMQALDAVYREHAPEVYVYGRMPPADAFAPRPVAGPFTPPELRSYQTTRQVTADDWAAFAGTISDHRRLPAARLARLQQAIRDAIARAGEPMTVRTLTTASFSRRI